MYFCTHCWAVGWVSDRETVDVSRMLHQVRRQSFTCGPHVCHYHKNVVTRVPAQLQMWISANRFQKGIEDALVAFSPFLSTDHLCD